MQVSDDPLNTCILEPRSNLPSANHATCVSPVIVLLVVSKACVVDGVSHLSNLCFQLSSSQLPCFYTSGMRVRLHPSPPSARDPPLHIQYRGRSPSRTHDFTVGEALLAAHDSWRCGASRLSHKHGGKHRNAGHVADVYVGVSRAGTHSDT